MNPAVDEIDEALAGVGEHEPFALTFGADRLIVPAGLARQASARLCHWGCRPYMRMDVFVNAEQGWNEHKHQKRCER